MKRQQTPPPRPQHLFIVRKYVRATDAADALRKEPSTPVDDVWVEDRNNKELPPAIGFHLPVPTEED